MSIIVNLKLFWILWWFFWIFKIYFSQNDPVLKFLSQLMQHAHKYAKSRPWMIWLHKSKVILEGPLLLANNSICIECVINCLYSEVLFRKLKGLYLPLKGFPRSCRISLCEPNLHLVCASFIIRYTSFITYKTYHLMHASGNIVNLFS